MGLERATALLARLGDPHLRLRALHVAGTNGKGSVCATLEALLRARGLRVGKYTSPHLVDFRERIVVDGRCVDEARVVDFIHRWTPAVEEIGASFFEATTALAFQHFLEERVDVAVVETGLGGRLDATNVIVPAAAGVTSIALDHVEWLGHTLEEIAAEKAGIFKPGAPAVVGETSAEIRALLASLAERAGAAPVWVVAEEMPVSDVVTDEAGTSFTVRWSGRDVRLRTGLAGAHQALNAATAIAMLRAAGGALEVAPDEVARTLPDVRLPGRFHRHGRYIFDVAHNPDGAHVLARTLRSLGPGRPLVALLAVLSDKDWRGMMEALAPVVDAFVLTTAPTAPAERVWDPSAAAGLARDRGWPARLEPDFDRALELAGSLGATVLVTGSFHTVGDAMSRLQVAPAAG